MEQGAEHMHKESDETARAAQEPTVTTTRRALCLVHYPVLDRTGATITTSVTNLDVHDLARSARTYGLSRYYIVTPIAAQRALVEGITEYWKTPSAQERLLPRTRALARVRVVASVADAVADLTELEGEAPELVATSAQPSSFCPEMSFREAARATKPQLLLFGTGHGLAADILAQCVYRLPPIDPGFGYVHLSVRAAVAIILDRLQQARPCAGTDS